MAMPVPEIRIRVARGRNLQDRQPVLVGRQRLGKPHPALRQAEPQGLARSHGQQELDRL